METNNIKDILINEYPEELVDSILECYLKALTEYRKGNWKYVGTEIGQFIENCRRMIEYKLNNSYTPLCQILSNFNEKELKNLENESGQVEYRIIIPRLLYSLYAIRNKRGMIHTSHINPNYMDATLLINNVKWILSELVRLSSNIDFDKSNELINSIMSKENNIIWEVNGKIRILNTKIDTQNKILCLLYYKDNQTDSFLCDMLEYKNFSRFKNILKKLHKERFIEYDNTNCILSPKGKLKAEEILKDI